MAVIDYPSVRAASASAETPAGDLFTLTVQRLSRPVSLESLTLRPGPEGLSDLPSGSQLVTANVTVGDAPVDSSADFERLQTIVVRKSGVSLTLTVVPQAPGGSVDVTPDQLRRATLSILDTPAADKLLA
jgi:hypothetical protein